jgi:hypothetical protein
MMVADLTEACRDRRRVEVLPEERRGVCVHRILLPGCDDAVAIADAFKDGSPYAAGSYTGREQPYSLLVWPDGRIEQALELGEYGPHAGVGNANRELIGVGAVGDFRKDPPTVAQYGSLVALCALLCAWVGRVYVTGHTEIPHDWRGKECPGRHLDMDILRHDVGGYLAPGWQDIPIIKRELALIEAGIVL